MCLPSLLQALTQIGLNVNYGKSCVVASAKTINKLLPKYLLGPLLIFSEKPTPNTFANPWATALATMQRCKMQSSLYTKHGVALGHSWENHLSQPAVAKSLLDRHAGA